MTPFPDEGLAVATEAVRHPRFARFYRWVAPAMDRGGLGDQRHRLLAGLTGDVIEVGVGEGRNLPHYPAQVDRLVAVEPEPLLRDAARDTARARAAVPVEVVDGRAERLDADDHSFDAAVVTCVLCSVTDPSAALRELHRVLRPGGQLRFIEHVRAGTIAGAVQRAADATLWPRLFGGCHTSRDVLATMAATGFRLERVQRLPYAATSIPFPAHPHVAGVAVRPGTATHR